MPNASTWAPEAAVAKQFGASEGASGAVAELCWHPIAIDGPAVRQRFIYTELYNIQCSEIFTLRIEKLQTEA